MVCAMLFGGLMIGEGQFITRWTSYLWIRSRSQRVDHLIDSVFGFALLAGGSIVTD